MLQVKQIYFYTACFNIQEESFKYQMISDPINVMNKITVVSYAFKKN